MNEGGFTLVELIIILSIWLLILSFTIPLVVKDVNKLKERQYLNSFQSDVIYAQSLAMGTENKVRITFTSTNYNIMENQRKIIQRTIPENWQVEASLMKNMIEFGITGQILNPGAINIKTAHSQYSIVFPFGKGRGYVVEK